ncbi:cold-shock protein [Fredinandcohnia sp. 179-A 10B2 NHS]|uniref:cold-shock protein n=1 Tax=Fredinandcohnia sp. 179-A 10B2 NHS TaxID=3235176 RepID=UPI0039A07303
MAFGRRPVEEIVTEETKVWECSSEDCNGWLRDNFKSTQEPLCPLCNSQMESTTKLLQVVDNHCKSYLA